MTIATVILIGLIPVIILLFGILISVKAAKFMAKYLEVLEFQKQSFQAQIKASNAPRILPPAVPKLLTYKETMGLFKRYITDTFQHTYLTEVLPQMTEAGTLNFKRLAPKDTTYIDLLSKVTVQVATKLPHYLKKSVYYHFGIIKSENDNIDLVDTDSPEYVNYSEFIVTYVKNGLDSKLLSLAAKAESDPNKVLGELYSEYEKNNVINDDSLKSAINSNQITSPDGTEVTLDTVNII